MNKLISKIKNTSYKYRSLIFIVLAVIIFSYLRNYQSDKIFDQEKFKNISKYANQHLDDVKEGIAFSNSEIDSIDYEKRRNTDLLDTEEIQPDNDYEHALVIIMAESQKFNIAIKENEKYLMEAQKDIYPDSFLLPSNLSNIDLALKSKKEVKVLKSSSDNFISEISNQFIKYEDAILRRIKNKEYSARIISGAKESINLSIEYQNIAQEQYGVLDKILDLCIQAIKEGTIQYSQNEDNIFFTTDLLVDKYNELVERFNKTVYAREDMQTKILKHLEQKNEKIKKAFD